MNEPAIAVHHLTRAFGTRDVLRDVSIEVREGEVFALQGANGSGKTTLLEILASGRALRARVGVLLEQLGLSRAARQRVEQYSDGMKARLCMARALLADPPVLLLDEPSKCLDPAGWTRVRELVMATTGGGPRTVIWVTHDQREAADVANRTGHLAAESIAQVPVEAS